MGYNIVQKTTPNKSSRCGWIPDIIVCHITEGSDTGAVSWLCNPDAQASSHFVVVQKGEITQLGTHNRNGLDKRYKHWNGNRHYSKSTSKLIRDRKTNANYYTIGIEHEGKYAETHGKLTDAQLQATIWLHGYIKEQVKKYTVLR